MLAINMQIDAKKKAMIGREKSSAEQGCWWWGDQHTPIHRTFPNWPADTQGQWPEIGQP